MRKDKTMSRKPWLWLWLLCLGLAACASQPKNAPNILLPQENRLQAASVAPSEQWYQAEWFWQGRSLAFLMLLQNEASGGHTLVATTLTGQELFALQEHKQQFTVLQQLPETKRIPLPYVYRDVAWASASTAAFAAMSQAEHEFSATSEHKIWRNKTQILWEAQLQADGAWLIDNKQAHYQMRLSPVSIDETSSNAATEVQP